MKRLFVSQPMNGLMPEEVKEARERIIAYAKKELGDDIEILDAYFEGKDGWAPLDYMVEGIARTAPKKTVSPTCCAALGNARGAIAR